MPGVILDLILMLFCSMRISFPKAKVSRCRHRGTLLLLLRCNTYQDLHQIENTDSLQQTRWIQSQQSASHILTRYAPHSVHREAAHLSVNLKFKFIQHINIDYY